ncbi:hypothetical protein EJ110_NYTH13118 [Nymphaea thermarum]|nr:hypothetical protein EJ110_NYTH13118 [Nymphaea thermarum]
MGWSHPDISLTDLLVLVKGFVDIVVLASGRQSSGLPVHWDAQNVKKALQWALFFEEVFQRIADSADYQDSVTDLDAAIAEITSDPSFPQGLAHLSSATLMKARDFMVEHLLNALPLRDAQLHSLLSAVVELDINGPSMAKQPEPYVVYANKLALYENSRDMPDSKSRCVKKLEAPRTISPMQNASSYSDISEIVLQEIGKKHIVVSCMSSLEANFDTLSEVITKSAGEGCTSSIWKEEGCDNMNEKIDETVESDLWSRWRSGCLTYLLNKRTVNLISGVSLIFHCPKSQWMEALESIKVSVAGRNGDPLEMIELCLLGLMSSTWKELVEQFTSCSFEVLSVSKLYHDMHNLLQRKSHFLDSAQRATDSKVNVERRHAGCSIILALSNRCLLND